MELRLETFIKNLEVISNVRNMDANNPIVHRISHATNATVHAIVAAYNEPHTLILPLNVTWIVFDPISPLYLQALRRVSKDPSDEYEHTWELVDTYDAVFVSQYYDAEDQAQLSDPSAPVPAQVGVLGIARLSAPAEIPSNPVVVVEGDPRLSDARPPLAHSHPEKPATQIRTSNGIVTVDGSAAPVNGATIVATSATTATWQRLKTSNLDA